MERLAGRIILLWGWRRALTAFLAGAFAVLAQAPYDFFAACFISFPVLVWLLDGAAVSGPVGLVRRLSPAFAIGWWFGFGYFLGGLWWIGNALLVEAEAFAWALPLAVVGIPLIMALFYGFAAALARLLWSNNIGRIAALAFGFGVAEWLRMILFTGFPWAAIGYAAMPVPLLMQSVSVVGLIGMNALAVFVFAMPALLAGRGGARLGFALAALIVAAHIVLGYVRLSTPPRPSERTLAVRIVQPSIAMTEKWDAAVADRGGRVRLLGAHPDDLRLRLGKHLRGELFAVDFFVVPFGDAVGDDLLARLALFLDLLLALVEVGVLDLLDGRFDGLLLVDHRHAGAGDVHLSAIGEGGLDAAIHLVLGAELEVELVEQFLGGDRVGGQLA
jgi:apolipoprotein N-acyltransferase